MRPVGSDDRASTSHSTNVGNGQAPSADVSLLKQGAPRAGSESAPLPKQPGRPVQAGGSATPPATVASTRLGNAPAMPAASIHTAQSLATPTSAAALCAMLRLPPDAISYATLAAMMGEHLPLDPASALSVRRFTRRHHDDPAAARLAARALASGAGLDDTLDPVLSAMMDVVFGDGGTGGGDAGGNGSSGAHQDEGQGNTDTCDEAEIMRLSKALKDGVGKVLLDPDLLNLSAPGKDGSGWACIPFDITIRGVSLHGFFRIWYYNDTKVGRMMVDVRFGEERRLFELAEFDGEQKMSYYSNDETENAAFVAEFKGRGSVRTSDLDSGYASEILSQAGVVADA